MSQVSGNGAGTMAATEAPQLPLPNIILRRPGKLELFGGPSSKADLEEQSEGLRIEKGFPEVNASSTEWSK